MTMLDSAGLRAAAPRAAAHKRWALAATCFGLFMALLDVTIVNVALPTIARDLNASFADLQWVVNAYTIAFAVFLVTAGRLGDIFGRKRVFMAGLGIFTLGSLLCALSGNLTIGTLTHTNLLLIARAIQGLGGSVMLPLSLAIISATFAGHERGAAIGIWGAVSGLGTAVGPVVGGILVQKVSWQSIFYLNVPIGLAGIALSAWAIRESRDERAPRSIDFFGLAAISIAVFCLILALIQGNDQDKGWTSPYILTLFGVSAIALLVFIVGELRLRNPMADPRLFRNPSFTGGAIIGFVLSGGFYALFFFLALYLQNLLGYNALDAGLRFLPLSGLILLGAPISGRLTDRFGPKPFLVIGTSILVIAVLLMLLIGGHDRRTDWVLLLPAFILGGLGSGIVNPPISTLAVGTVEGGRAGMASGVAGLCRQVGAAFGIAFLGAILTARYNSLIHDRILAMRVPPAISAYITPHVKEQIIAGIQKAGTIAGSTGLKGDAAHPNPYASSPLAPQLEAIARGAFLDALTSIFVAAAVMLAIGALAALILVRRSDLHAPGDGAAAAI